MLVLIVLLFPFLGLRSTLILGCFLSILSYFYHTISDKQKFWQRKQIKHLEPTFLLGNLSLRRVKSFAERVRDLYQNYPNDRYFGIYLFTTPTLVVKDPELIKEITIKSFNHFTDHREVISEDLDPFFARGLAATGGQKWHRLRSALSPSFTGHKMRMMFELMRGCARDFVAFHGAQGGCEVELKGVFRRYTNDVIASTAFGVKIDSLAEPDNDFYRMGAEAADFSGWKTVKFFLYGLSPTLAKVLQLRIIPARVANYFSRAITETVRARAASPNPRPDMITLMMQTLDLDEMISQAFLFFLAGFETVSTLLSFLAYELAVNPAIQDALRAEIRTVSDDVTYDTLTKLKYLDNVIQETLRKWPPAVIANRKVTKNYTIRTGNSALELEKDLAIWIPIYELHYDERYFPDPEKFDPERFNGEIQSGTFLPFGLGPRNCIGSRFAVIEAKILIFELLKNLEIYPVARTRIPLVLDKGQIIPTAEGGMWVGLRAI